MNFVILGGRGFIGTALVKHLKNKNASVRVIEPADVEKHNISCDVLIYAIGLTADFRSRLSDTLEAHVCLLRNMLHKIHFKQVFYFSSTRVYQGSVNTMESADIILNPFLENHFYNLSKIMGEALCLNLFPTKATILRVSNVIGNRLNRDSFLGQIITEAIDNRAILLRDGGEVGRDFVLIEDVVEAVYRLAMANSLGVYNIASGEIFTSGDIARRVALETKCKLIVNNQRSSEMPRLIKTEKLIDATGFTPSSIKMRLSEIIKVNLNELRSS